MIRTSCLFIRVALSSLALSLLSHNAVSIAADFASFDEHKTVAPGVTAKRGTLILGSRRAGALSVDVDVAKAGIYVLTNRNRNRFGNRGRKNGSALGYSVKEYGSSPGVIAAISGGYLSSLSPPLPLGYVRTDGKEHNSTHRSWLTDGMLCMNGGVPKLWDTYQPPDAAGDCLQAGPILVRGGRSVPSPKNKTAKAKLWDSEQEQALICVDRGIVRMIATGPIPVRALLPVLTDPQSPIACQDALRLTGAVTANLFVKSFGALNDNAPLLPNALVVVPH